MATQIMKILKFMEVITQLSGILFSTLPDGNAACRVHCCSEHAGSDSKAVQPADHTISLLYEKEGRGLKLVLAMMSLVSTQIMHL